ncbi:Mycinamicin VI 2''-O-methyltransferase, partial [Tetrabaena socialis]
VWREYLPHAEIWFAEFDAACVDKYRPELAQLNERVVTGDQADIPTLQRWVNETGGNFDVIVDDGGHSNMMYNSFYTLFYQALRPGGLYIIEDIHASRTGQYVDGDMQHQTVYGKAFEVHAGAHRTHKLLEIGLGCDMWYGPGHSAKVWREYLPHAEIWFAEYNAACVDKYRAELAELNEKVVTGDQADIPTLQRWVNETGGNFDVIVDDGGHSNMMYNSFYTLFYQALRPGGLYVIEDMQASRTGKYVDGDKEHQ